MRQSAADCRDPCTRCAKLCHHARSFACRHKRLRLPSRPQAAVGHIMVFSSSVFLFYFLPLFLICYFALPFKNLVLLVFSLFFYAWGEGLYVLLMIASGLGNFHLAKLISQAEGAQRRRDLFLGVALNLAGLIVFKYTGFLLESWNA